MCGLPPCHREGGQEQRVRGGADQQTSTMWRLLDPVEWVVEQTDAQDAKLLLCNPTTSQHHLPDVPGDETVAALHLPGGCSHDCVVPLADGRRWAFEVSDSSGGARDQVAEGPEGTADLPVFRSGGLGSARRAIAGVDCEGEVQPGKPGQAGHRAADRNRDRGTDLTGYPVVQPPQDVVVDATFVQAPLRLTPAGGVRRSRKEARG